MTDDDAMPPDPFHEPRSNSAAGLAVLAGLLLFIAGGLALQRYTDDVVLSWAAWVAGWALVLFVVAVVAAVQAGRQ